MHISGIRRDALFRNVPHTSPKRPGLVVARPRGTTVEPPAGRPAISMKDKFTGVLVPLDLSSVALGNFPVAPIVAAPTDPREGSSLNEHGADLQHLIDVQDVWDVGRAHVLSEATGRHLWPVIADKAPNPRKMHNEARVRAFGAFARLASKSRHVYAGETASGHQDPQSGKAGPPLKDVGLVDVRHIGSVHNTRKSTLANAPPVAL